MITKKYYPYFLLIFSLILLYFSFKIFQPFIITTITAFILAYIFYPLYKWILTKVKNETISALIVTIILVLVIVIPLAFILNTLIQEALNLYNTINLEAIKSLITDSLNINLPELNIDEIIKNALLSLASLGSDIILSLPQKILNFFVMLFFFFFGIRDGSKIVENLYKKLPLKKKYKKQIFKKVRLTIDSLVFGEIIISIIEGVIASIMFYFLGINSPIFFGLLIGIFALLPLIGPAAVYMPIGIYKLLVGEYLVGSLILILGFTILSFLLDTIVKPKVLGMRGHIHPLIIIIGVFGGLTVFGLPGLILGPIILVILQLIVQIYFGLNNETKSKKT
jgi:predicted PurR-regulated permease PerM